MHFTTTKSPTMGRREHLSVRRIRDALARELKSLESRALSALRVEPLEPRKAVADATTKAIVRTQDGTPVAVIICSPPVAPGLVARGVQAAEAIRSMLDEPTASAIIAPIHTGTVDGMTCVILPWFQPIRCSRVKWLWQRRLLRRPLLDWLRKANAQSARELPPVFNGTSYEQALLHLKKQPFITGAVKCSLERSLARLHDSVWTPLYTFDHNDLWHENVLLRTRKDDTGASNYPFALIDWSGANQRGFGMYDLMRICRSLKVPTLIVRREVEAHCRILGGTLLDAPGHLLAALGQLHMRLEHFPEQRYLVVFQACWEQLHQALAINHHPIARELSK